MPSGRSWRARCCVARRLCRSLHGAPGGGAGNSGDLSPARVTVLPCIASRQNRPLGNFLIPYFQRLSATRSAAIPFAVTICAFGNTWRDAVQGGSAPLQGSTVTRADDMSPDCPRSTAPSDVWRATLARGNAAMRPPEAPTPAICDRARYTRTESTPGVGQAV